MKNIIKGLVALALMIFFIEASASHDRECVAVIDTNTKVANGVSHMDVVAGTMAKFFPLVSIVRMTADTKEEMAEALDNPPCRVVNISRLSAWVALVVLEFNVKLDSDTQYVIAVGNINGEAQMLLERHGWFVFPSNVLLVAGNKKSDSIPCAEIRFFTATKCITLKNHGEGVVKYRGRLYRGSSFASPIAAAMFLLKGFKLLAVHRQE